MSRYSSSSVLVLFPTASLYLLISFLSPMLPAASARRRLAERSTGTRRVVGGDENGTSTEIGVAWHRATPRLNQNRATCRRGGLKQLEWQFLLFEMCVNAKAELLPIYSSFR